MKLKSKSKAKKIILYTIFGVVYFLGVIIIAAVHWSRKVYNVSLVEFIQTITSPQTGNDAGVFSSAVKGCLPIILIFTVVFILCVVFLEKIRADILIRGTLFKKTFSVNIVKIFCVFMTFVIFGSSILYCNREYDLFKYIQYTFLEDTKIYDTYYLDPADVLITNDNETKNLIYIYMESMETAYASVENGGFQDANYIPRLTELAEDNISFSNSDKLGGFRSVSGTTWTMGALFATASGVPFAFPVGQNTMSKFGSFANGISTMGDVLAEKGYNQEFLCGSDAEFGGRENFYLSHGNYEIYDLFDAREDGYIPADYYEWWGYEDKYLYEIAKDEIKRLAAEDKPFNLTMLTVDTHFPDGYVCELCEDKYDTVAANVISCADRQLKSFVDWCKEQPFYKDTVIVIVGDHPRMDVVLVDGIDYYDRTMYNCILNADIDCSPDVLENRVFTAMDMFPTVISAMGFKIDGERLGLGTNLFSGMKTLPEELGYDYFVDEISKRSDYFVTNFS